MTSDSALGVKVVKELTEAGVESTPPRFEVWYLHRKGAEPEMSQQIDYWLEMHHRISAQFLDRLYKEYIQNAIAVRKVFSIAERFNEPVETINEVMAEQAAAVRNFRMEIARLAPSLASDFRDEQAELQSIRDLHLLCNKFMDRSSEGAEVLAEALSEIMILQGAMMEAKRATVTDQKSGLVNRRAFEENLQNVLDQAVGGEAETSVVICDISNENADYGDEAGDVGADAIKLVSKILAQNTKGKDVVARYSAGEFALLLPGTATADAISLAQKIKSEIAVKRLRRRRQGDSPGELVVTFGVAACVVSKAAEDVLKEAETALNRAKAAGGNRVLSFDRLQAAESPESVDVRLSA